jgi:FlaA1/EpsC-like NDP-sugar epimerase
MRSALRRAYAVLRGAWSSPAIRQALVVGYDAIAAALALLTAFLLRFEGTVPPEWLAKVALPILVGIRVVATCGGQLHRWSFRVCGLMEALRLIAVTLGGSAAFVVVLGLLDLILPRTVLVLEFFFTTTLLAALRFGPRLAAGWYAEQARTHSNGVRRTLIVGAGGAGDLLARDLRRSTEHPYQVVGFVDDNPNKVGSWVAGKPVLGRVDDLPHLIGKHRISMVLLAITHLPAERIRRILALCASQRASFKIIPASFAALDGRISAAMLHDLAPEDLLSRDQVAFDESGIRDLLKDRRILITGAAGSIGGELALQAARYGARQLILVDVNENELYLRARWLGEEYPGLELHAEVADIREPQRLTRLGLHYRPEYVFHAAAHKHVPLMEDAPEEAVKNNVFGTLNVARMAEQCEAERFVLISTDKAVKPSSIMGATKRVAELLVRDLARSSSTRMTCVRFGNVLGSQGSVVPLFKQQIERGGPVTVTHPDCTRYFMTIGEAVGLVLLAGLTAEEELCILDMGEAIRIADLAAHLITLSGRIPGAEIPIVFTGLRPGEKLHEELLTEEEELTQVVSNRIRAAKSPAPPANLARRLEELRRLADSGDVAGIRRVLKATVPSCQWELAPVLSLQAVRPEPSTGRNAPSVWVTPP